ncbi:NAD(P)-dependent oxidoreductase [Marinobacterium sp. YM272]|uniref:NAD(P)-dependent oxidoreductase n=1 Tax=Marinobacterium sp. YM272 TaxID=3421654 RepID=UPI003D7FF6DD
MSSIRIGFIGMGLMGVPMSTRLVDAGFPVSVWNRNPEKSKPLAERGTQVAASIAELCANSDVIMTCVSDTDAVRKLVFGDQGIAESCRQGQILIDFSSIAPDATQEMAAHCKAQYGIDWIDAPVSGGVAGAEQGTLAIMAGGEAELVERIRPLLAPLSQRVTHMGPVGSGQATKICNQMLVSCNVLVMAEVMALAERSGVDATRIPEALKGGFADSIPLQLTGPKMAARDFDEIKWHVKTLLKDLDMANALAKANGSAIPMAGLGAELMRLHGSKGYLEQDPATLVEAYRAGK